MIKEFCAENYTDIPQAIANGALRIELCDNLTVGGTTPSNGVMEETFRYCQEKQIPVMTMIRPRGGDFVYNDVELRMMQRDLFEAKKSGTDGVVFGCLTPEGWLDEEALEWLIDEAAGLQITFHMAFDAIASDRQLAAIDWLVAHGVDRILTHGGPAGTAIEANLPRLKEYLAYAQGKITILPGGGITNQNVDAIQSALSVQEAHGTKIVGTF